MLSTSSSKDNSQMEGHTVAQHGDLRSLNPKVTINIDDEDAAPGTSCLVIVLPCRVHTI